MPKNEFICDCSAVHEDIVNEVSAKLTASEREALEKAAAFLKIFGDPTRMRIMWALDRHEMCVCDLANVLSMTKSAVSHQLAILRNAALVKYRREVKTVYYSLADHHVKSIVEAGMEHINE